MSVGVYHGQAFVGMLADNSPPKVISCMLGGAVVPGDSLEFAVSTKKWYKFKTGPDAAKAQADAVFFYRDTHAPGGEPIGSCVSGLISGRVWIPALAGVVGSPHPDFPTSSVIRELGTDAISGAAIALVEINLPNAAT